VSRKRSNVGARVCVLMSFLVLSAAALTVSPAQALSEGRVYEQVSPEYKGGLGAGGLRMVSADGERVAFDSLGVFAGTQWNTLTNFYLAERVNGSGWSVSSLQPSPGGIESAFSSGLEYVEGARHIGETKREGPSEGFEYILHRVDSPNVAANWEALGTPVAPIDGEPYTGLALGASGDLCHQILGFTAPLLPEAEGTFGQIYDQSRGCGGAEPYLRLVALDNAGDVINPHCGPELGVNEATSNIPFGGKEARAGFNAIGPHGDTIFFTTSVEQSALCRTGQQLFARLGGERTLEVSKPLGEVCADVPCAGALARSNSYFKGASEDGSLVYFTTRAPLVGGDQDTGNDLYLARIGCGEGEAGCAVSERRVLSLVQVSHDPVAGQSADVQGVSRVASDGSRVYFVAHGVLSEGANAEGRAPVSGAENLYVYDARTAATVFIAELCSAPAASGSVQDTACPASLTGGGTGRNDSSSWGYQGADSTRDGRVLVFNSWGQLTPDDSDSALDVYRYDSESGLLTRVSVGENGYDANGNDEFSAGANTPGIYPGSSPDHQQELTIRAVSDDGSRIVFTSEGPLSPRAENGLANIYEWHAGAGPHGEGAVSLISSGSSSTSDETPTISPSGRDIFFVTAAGLVPGDTDGLRDIYDARLDGGFPVSAAPRQSCSGDACQGPLSNPAPLLVPGSASQTPADKPTLAVPAIKPKPTSTQTLARALKACHAKHNKRKRASCEHAAHKKHPSTASTRTRTR
jgi:hypothetical protein